MRKVMFAALIFSGFFAITSADLNACGEKMFSMGSGVRYSLFPPSVLLYRKDPVLEAAIKHGGYNLHVASTTDDVTHAMNSKKVAAVVYDPSDASAIESIAKSAPSKPVLIPLPMLAPKSSEAKYRETISKAVKQGRG